jgi:hypothetical protein
MLALHRIDNRHALDILGLGRHHVTLRFVGGLPAAAGPAVAEGMRQSAARETVAYGDKLRGNSCTSQS